jgi:hypothetical protein
VERLQFDLSRVKLPVLPTNGEFNRPNATMHGMQRELANCKSVVLPGKSHLTAIMAGYIPKEYAEVLVGFIAANDPKPQATAAGPRARPSRRRGPRV